jgi:hypothetical protein
MKIIDIQGPFSEKWLDLCEKVYAALYQAYKEAIDKKDKVAEASLAAALIKQQREVDRAWEIYNEEIGDGIDWKKIYEKDE